MSAVEYGPSRTILERAAKATTVNRLHHAWMLTAIEAEPLESLSRSLARQNLCMADEQTMKLGGCGTCQSCRQFDAGAHPDRFELIPDAKGTITVDAVRGLVGDIGLRPALSASKVILVSQVEAMNAAAQNALLKTLEEPPAETLFVLTTTRYQGLLETIRSRVQRHHLQVNVERDQDLFTDTLLRLNAQTYSLDLEEDAEKIEHWRGQLTALRGKPDPLLAFGTAQEIGGKGESVETFEQWLKVLGAQLKTWLQDPNLNERDRNTLWRVHERLMQYERERVFNPSRLHVTEHMLLMLNGAVGANHV